MNTILANAAIISGLAGLLGSMATFFVYAGGYLNARARSIELANQLANLQHQTNQLQTAQTVQAQLPAPPAQPVLYMLPAPTAVPTVPSRPTPPLTGPTGPMGPAGPMGLGPSPSDSVAG